MRNKSLLLLATMWLAPSAASALDVPVTYMVEEAYVKTTAIAGTPLTFALFTDADCTTLAHSEVVNVEETTLLSRLTILTPRGAVRLPKTVDIRHTLTGVPVASPFYLEVTGTGIVPLGRACQPQAGSTPGAPGPAGPSGLASIATFAGQAPTVIPPTAVSDFIFVGPTSTVTVTAGQRLTGSARASLGSDSAGSGMILGVDLCYRVATQVVSFFAAATGSIPEVRVTKSYESVTAVGSTLAPVSGTYTVGLCITNGNLQSLDANDFVNGWVMVTN